MAGRERVEFDIVGKDAGGSKAFKDVGDAADKAADKIHDTGRAADKAGDEAEAAGKQYRGLAHDIAEAQAAAAALAAEINKTGNLDLVKDLDRQRREIRKLTRVQDLLPGDDDADEAAEGFVGRFVARLGPLMASAPVHPAGAAIGAALGVGAAATLASAMSGAIVGGAGIGGVIGGVRLAARDPAVKAAGADLGQFILGDLERRSADFVPAVLDGISDIRAGWQSLGPDLDKIFQSQRFIEPLVASGITGGQKLAAGLADAIEQADPVVDALGRTIDQVGDSAGQMLSTLADDADEGASAIDDLTLAMGRLIDTTTAVVHGGAAVKSWSDELDIAIDRGRYWLEDMEHYKDWLDLTADGFGKGTKEAEAYRKATLGNAEAQDFATLKAAGMSDAQIAAADASGTYRQQLDEVNRSLGTTPAKVEDAAAAMREWRAALDEMTSNNLDARQAQRDLEEAIDAASAAVRTNGQTAIQHGAALDINTAKGRANAAALDRIAAEANGAYDAVMAQTGSQDLANAAADRGRAKMIELARKMGLSESAARDLANQLIRIKDRKVTVTANTAPAMAAANRLVARINNMKARINVYAEPSGGFGGGAHTGFGYSTGMSEGGPVVGPGAKGVDSLWRKLAPGEHVWTDEEVDAAGGHAAMERMRAMVRGDAPARPTAGGAARRSGSGDGAGQLDEARIASALAGVLSSGVTLVLDDRTGRTATLMARGA
ncbi:hypothetical protein ACWCHM_26165 [Micromonospora sp. SCSIO 07396]